VGLLCSGNSLWTISYNSIYNKTPTYGPGRRSRSLIKIKPWVEGSVLTALVLVVSVYLGVNYSKLWFLLMILAVVIFLHSMYREGKEKR
jgi:hypothetical protein